MVKNPKAEGVKNPLPRMAAFAARSFLAFAVQQSRRRHFSWPPIVKIEVFFVKTRNGLGSFLKKVFPLQLKTIFEHERDKTHPQHHRFRLDGRLGHTGRHPNLLSHSIIPGYLEYEALVQRAIEFSVFLV